MIFSIVLKVDGNLFQKGLVFAKSLDTAIIYGQKSAVQLETQFPGYETSFSINEISLKNELLSDDAIFDETDFVIALLE